MVFINNGLVTEGTHYEWVYNQTRGRWGVAFYSQHNPASSDNIRIVYKSKRYLQNDMSPSPHEPGTPYVIGEWAFDLTWANVTQSTNQFRCVTAYGVTDYHDADDTDKGSGHQNTLDREVVFQLDEVFNPWDLNDSVHKQENDWLYKATLTSSANSGRTKPPELGTRTSCRLETPALLHG
jgi:hypothetical protein